MAEFKDITLPELKPLCVFVFITVTIGAFRMLVQPMVMTGGGPDHSTYTLVYDIYENRHNELGDGTCINNGNCIYNICCYPDDHTECTDQRKGGEKTC